MRFRSDPPEDLLTLVSRPPLVVPGVVDALTARIVERAGFDACYVTGAGFANAAFGIPDLGVVSASELVEHVRRIAEAVSIPVIVDADTGFGGPVSVARVVRSLERAGAAAAQIEDQISPKRCGHFEGVAVIPTGEMVEKVLAATEAREDSRFMIIARTDAIQSLGFEEAIARGRAYLQAGADAVFVEAPSDMDQLRRIPLELDGPTVVNVVEGGKTPHLDVEAYTEMGFDIVLHANFVLRAQIQAAREALAHLSQHGGTRGYTDKIAGWSERQELVALSAYEGFEEEIGRRAREGWS